MGADQVWNGDDLRGDRVDRDGGSARLARTDPAGFGIALKAVRETRRPWISQAALAELVGFDHSYVSRLEAGTRQPTRGAVESIALALGVTEDERRRLLHGAGFTTGTEVAETRLVRMIAEFETCASSAERELLRVIVATAIAGILCRGNLNG